MAAKKTDPETPPLAPTDTGSLPDGITASDPPPVETLHTAFDRDSYTRLLEKIEHLQDRLDHHDRVAARAADRAPAAFDLDHAFSYHPPTAEQGHRYAAINEAFRVARTALLAAVAHPDSDPATFGGINALTKDFARVILENAPASADRTAAIRCVALARNAANEAQFEAGYAHKIIVEANLFAAKWQACTAIALAG